MEPTYKIEQDGRISITVKIKPEGSFLEQEEQIAEVGRLASRLAMKVQDTTRRGVSNTPVSTPPLINFF